MLAAIGANRRHGGHVHHRATIAQVGDAGAGQAQCAQAVHVDRLGDVGGVAIFDDAPVAVIIGAVDQPVNATAKCGACLFGQLSALRFVRNVAGDGDCLAALGHDIVAHLFQKILVARGEYDRRTFGRG